MFVVADRLGDRCQGVFEGVDPGSKRSNDTVSAADYRVLRIRVVRDRERTIMAFDIEDRTTWAWNNGGSELPLESWAGDSATLDPVNPANYYRFQGGQPYVEVCPPGLRYNPEIGTCDYPQNCGEAYIYDWCVKQGMVTDQR